MGKPSFECVVPLPDPYISSPFPLIILPSIVFPTWFYIPPLGPNRANHPLPFPHILGRAWKDAQEVDADKIKKKKA